MTSEHPLASRPSKPSYLESGGSLLDRLRTRLVGREILRRLPVSGPLRLLDLGCGYHGAYLKMLAARLEQGIGVDLRVTPLEIHPRVRLIASPLDEALPSFPAGGFDVVLFISVLEHLWDPQQCLAHCYRLLQPGGRLLLNVPTWYAKPVLECSAFRLGTSPAAEMDDHKMYYSKRDLWPLLVRAGFKPSRIRLNYQHLLMTLFAKAVKQ